MKNLLIISLSLVFLISCEVEQSKNIYLPPKNETKPIRIEAHNNLIVNNLFILAYFVFKII